MALKITLKANEGLIVNGALLRNGDRPARLTFEGECRFLRESEILRASDAGTPAKDLLVTLQALYMAEPAMRAPLDREVLDRSRAIVEAAPSLAPHVAAIAEALVAGRHHVAIKAARELVAGERALIDRALAA